MQGFDFLMQGFDFEVQGICSNINGNSRFWQSFDFVVEKKSKQKQNVNLLVLPQNFIISSLLIELLQAQV